MIHTLLYASMAVLGLGANDKPRELLVGDSAPKLEVQEFVRGAPVKQFEHGKTYVVEFWATWCAPCRESIPHLTALQKKYKDAIFIGVSIDQDVKTVKPFVAKQGEKMGYRVAVEARDGDKGRMEETWLEPSYQGGIPTAYVIDGDGKVAWIGHPKDLEEPVKLNLAGEWDLAAKAAEFKAALTAQKQDAVRKSLADRLGKALAEKRYDDALKVADEAEAKEIDVNNDSLDPRVRRLAVLVISGSQDAKAAELGQQLMSDSPDAPGPIDNGSVVAAIIDPQRVLIPETEVHLEEIRFVPAAKIAPALAKVAAEAADKTAGMQEALPNGFGTADDHLLLARAYQAAGETKKAVQEIKTASDSLGQTVRRANEAIDKAHQMQKEIESAGGKAGK